MHPVLELLKKMKVSGITLAVYQTVVVAGTSLSIHGPRDSTTTPLQPRWGLSFKIGLLRQPDRRFPCAGYLHFWKVAAGGGFEPPTSSSRHKPLLRSLTTELPGYVCGLGDFHPLFLWLHPGIHTSPRPRPLGGLHLLHPVCKTFCCISITKLGHKPSDLLPIR